MLREIYFIALSFLIALVMNIAGIAKHGTAWKALITRLHVVVILAMVIYLLLWFVRLLIYVAMLPGKSLFKKKKPE